LDERLESLDQRFKELETALRDFAQQMTTLARVD